MDIILERERERVRERKRENDGFAERNKWCGVRCVM